jgi:hypothetical protein
LLNILRPMVRCYNSDYFCESKRLGFGTGRQKEWSLSDGKIPNVRGVREALGTGYNPGDWTRRAWRNGRVLISHPIRNFCSSVLWMQVGTDAPPEELQQQRMVLAQANELERKKVDQVFTERNGWDTKTKDIDHQVPSNPIHVNARL